MVCYYNFFHFISTLIKTVHSRSYISFKILAPSTVNYFVISTLEKDLAGKRLRKPIYEEKDRKKL
jgi:hypothetical protein